MHDLSGRRALFVGGSSGMGLAAARLFHKLGAEVILAGRSGVSGRVNRRFGERFGAAALISLLSSGPALASNEIENDMARDGATRVSGDLRDATGSVVSEYLSLPPIITINQGARVTVMVDRDLEIF